MASLANIFEITAITRLLTICKAYPAPVIGTLTEHCHVTEFMMIIAIGVIFWRDIPRKV